MSERELKQRKILLEYVIDYRKSENRVENRQVSNGIFNKAVRNTISKEEASRFHVVLWDVIPLEDWKRGICNVPYIKRLEELKHIMSTMQSHKVSLVEGKTVSTMQEIHEFYDEMIARGQEGAMVKPANMIWENRRSKQCLKLKEIKDATLRCVGVTPHSKRPHLIGSLECETADGKVQVSIGAGLDERDREQPPEYFVDKLIDMQYNALITSRGNATMSMFLPRYCGIRLDQDSADTLEKLK